jgi:hypothetical protein
MARTIHNEHRWVGLLANRIGIEVYDLQSLKTKDVEALPMVRLWA